jgi:ergothioneine biosynthesis protein EgtB
MTAGWSAEDQQVQSMADASPTKWHLAHTTWFFETLVLCAHVPGHRPHDARYPTLFNSYYESLGPRVARAQRGLITRPTLQEVLAYRAAVDRALLACIDGARDEPWRQIAPLLQLGIAHEEQHQELILTDLLHALSCNPLQPAALPASDRAPAAAAADPDDGWFEMPEGAWTIGHSWTIDSPPGHAFAFDNEGPRHTVHLPAYQLSRRLVSNADVQAFIDDGGYRTASLWLSDGWARVQAEGWQAPAYWLPGERGHAFSLQGALPLDPQAPATHLSFYEACALAEWAGARLPTEFEWEAAARRFDSAAPAPTAADRWPSPRPRRTEAGDPQFFGAVWQWTRSSYDPYPGYRPWQGAVGEYNGKFMVGQQVLRGSSCATPPGHSRPSYRNFFPPAARWQFSGLRLAR